MTCSLLYENSSSSRLSCSCCMCYIKIHFITFPVIAQSSNVHFPMQVTVTGSNDEAEASKIARSVAASSLVKVWCCLTAIYCSTGLYEHCHFFLLHSLSKEAWQYHILGQAAVFGRDPNWGRIACAVGYSGIHFNADQLDISLGVIPLMKNGQPLPFDRLKKPWLHMILNLVVWIPVNGYCCTEHL